MSGFFDDSHVTDVGLEGSAGPSVGFLDMVQQGYRQQFRVDSALALNNELQNRWLESLRAAQIQDGAVSGLDESWAYVAMAQHVKGEPIDINESPPLGVVAPIIGPMLAARTAATYIKSPDRLARIKGMIDANERIKQLGDPNIKSFEQILEEVTQMQHEVEGETASMWERSGTAGVMGSFLGAMGGSFTVRDPLNLVTAPLGYGRAIATRVATEMGIAAGVVGATEYLQVAPAREIVDLPERDPLYNILAAAAGAGAIRGGLEGIGYGLRRMRSGVEEIDFDLRDSQLAQMFENNSASPSARAGASLLDDTRFVERNNPYGEGRAAQERFIAELQSIQRAMNGEPMTAVARVLPPIPFDELKKVADFEIVREQSPQIYARMEAAQIKLASIRQASNATPTIIGGDELSAFIQSREGLYFSLAQQGLVESADEGLKKGERVILYLDGRPIRITQPGMKDSSGKVWEPSISILTDINRSNRLEIAPKKATPKERRTANAEYQAAYREVEAEAVRIRERQTAVEAAQQREAVNILADATPGRVFNMSLLTHDNVQARVDAINAFTDTLDEKSAAMFVRQLEEGPSVKEGAEPVEREAWRTEAGIDIGLREPVDPEFRISTDDGDITVAAAMRDLQDDADLDAAMKACMI